MRWVAQHSGHPLISGGDRHGLEPNAIVNLTNAGSFSEFVAEVREDKISDVLFMNQCREPIRLRGDGDDVGHRPGLPRSRRRAGSAGAIAFSTARTTVRSNLYRQSGPATSRGPCGISCKACA